MATNPIFADVPAWPTPPVTAPRAGLGHNKPPLEELVPAEFREALLADRADFLVRFEELIEAAGRARAVDDETLGRCGDLVNAYRKCETHINATHKTVKQPYLDGGRLVDGEKNDLIAKLADAKRKVEGIGNAFVAKRDAEIRAERERIAAEERRRAEEAASAEALRQEAADANDVEGLVELEAVPLAAAVAAKPEPVRSDSGAVVSGKQEWKSEVTDYAAAFAAVSDNPKVQEAIDKAVAALVRAGKREIAGCRIWPVAKANFR